MRTIQPIHLIGSIQHKALETAGATPFCLSFQCIELPAVMPSYAVMTYCIPFPLNASGLLCLCIQSVYQSCCPTVLSELYQEKLVTEDEVKRMKGGGYPSDRVVNVQYTKPPEVMRRTTDMLDKYGHNEKARQLRGW